MTTWNLNDIWEKTQGDPDPAAKKQKTLTTVFQTATSSQVERLKVVYSELPNNLEFGVCNSQL